MKHFYLFLTLLFSMSVIGQTPFTSTITPDLSVYGETMQHPGEGEYQIFLSADNILDKPIFLVDGFDPGDSRPINGYTDTTSGNYVSGIYDLLNFNDGTPSNLGDVVRADGYDIVILNFPEYVRAADAANIDGGTDFIERNSMLLVDLITIVNGMKVGTEENVIIGPSMGGVISRHALKYMENQAIAHETRLFISFDSPHLGANVPLGFQHQFNYFAFGLGANNVTALQPVVDGFLKSSAARQLLVDHFSSHLAAGSEVEFDPTLLEATPDPFRGHYLNDVNAGFPQNVRNVSMINGSGIGTPYQDKLGADILPGFEAINDIFDLGSGITAEVKVNFKPVENTTLEISFLKVDLDFGGSPINLVTTQASSQSTTFKGVDAASGGLFDITGLTAGIDTSGITGEFLAALKTEQFSFIPSVSAMAMEVTNNEVNWFHDIDLGVPGTRDVVDNTPFANWHMPDANENHTALTASNVQFALAEINQTTLSIGGINSDTEIRLEKNPVRDVITILSNTVINSARFTMTDITGKTVLSSTQDLNNRTSIPVNLTSGLYILNINTPENGNFVTKVVIR